ncbi:MAG: hypothetical protein MRY49_01230 [Candidatus Pacebacteria bacterium]|nr:hypothetical protein [Candidatus Paceibacterota bacterium]
MKKHLPLIVALLLPVVVVAGILLTIYISKVQIEPTYNMVYVLDNPYPSSYAGYRYDVKEGQIVKTNLPEAPSNTYRENSNDPKLYIYDFDTETSKEIIDISDIQIEKVGSVSPDGYSVSYSYGRNSGIFEIFGGYSSERVWLVKHGNSGVYKKVDIPTSDYYRNPEVLGWISK